MSATATGTVAGGIRGRSYQAHINERTRHGESSEGEKPELRSWGRTYFAPLLLTRLPHGAMTPRPDYRQLFCYTLSTAMLTTLTILLIVSFL
jgi:hypothetical protein